VVDSGSADATVDIARRAGANVVHRPFDNWAAHQNWCVQNVPFIHDWVLYLDADERVSPELAENAMRVAATQTSYAAFRVQRRDFLEGRWLRHVQASPYYVRVFRPGRVRYERLVNPVTLVDGAVGDLAGFLDHYPFSKGWGHWLERHNSYSSLEAHQQINEAEQGQRFRVSTALLSRDFHTRRLHQKGLFSKLPGRPLLRFVYLYLFRRGFLDGGPGLRYAAAQAVYEYMIALKRKELELRSRSNPRLPPEDAGH
jgi:glycosyltransferase involved in cell wall biosynthesis